MQRALKELLKLAVSPCFVYRRREADESSECVLV
jgi:hypothetical protein